MRWSLDQYRSAGQIVKRMYMEVLRREQLPDLEEMLNWVAHMREDNQNEAWLLEQFMASPEYMEMHAGDHRPNNPAPLPPVNADPGRDRDELPAPPPDALGGFMEHATSTAVRPLLTREQMADFIPISRGPFRFPAPYHSLGIRVTVSSDGRIPPIGYSYWSNINYHAGQNTLLVFCGGPEDRPLLFRVNKHTHAVEPLGPFTPYRGTGEGWYFSVTQSDVLYLHDGPRMHRVNVFTGEDEVVFDISAQRPGCRVFQMHSSDDGLAHSATVQRITNDGPYEDVGAMVSYQGELRFYDKQALYDECQVDKSGEWLVIRETYSRNGHDHLDNRIIRLRDGSERHLLDEDGAVGHSDCGWGTVVGEVDQRIPGELTRIDLLTGEPSLHYHLTLWGGSGLGHVSERQDVALISNLFDTAIPRVNELGVVRLDGSRQIRIMAPNLTLGSYRNYDLQVKANMDPLGEYCAWTGNMGTEQLVLFLLKLR